MQNLGIDLTGVTGSEELTWYRHRLWQTQQEQPEAQCTYYTQIEDKAG